MIIKTVNITGNTNYEITFNESSKKMTTRRCWSSHRPIYYDDAKTAIIYQIARYTNSERFTITHSKLTKINRYTELYIHYLGSIEEERIYVKTFFDEKFPFKLKYIIDFFDLDKQYVKHYLEDKTIVFENEFNTGEVKRLLNDFADELGYKNRL